MSCVRHFSTNLPILALCEFNVDRNKVKEFQYIRTINEDTLASLSDELSQQSWESVLNTNDVNQAYDTFLHIFTNIFQKHCPVKRVSKKSYINNKPWFTKGLRNACVKKNKLYKAFVVSKSAEAEQKCKTYKNKLTSILIFIVFLL